MKRLIAYLVSPVLFGLGHAVSVVMHAADFLGNLYPVYNWLMLASSDLEDWAGINLMWEPVTK